MELLGVRVELPANAPIVLLRESVGDRRVLPIYIGTAEAAAIAYALENVEVPRPMTHDLLRNILEEIGAEPLDMFANRRFVEKNIGLHVS